MKYFDLLDDLKTIYTELSYNSRWVRIAMFHLLGKTLLENMEIASGHLKSIASALNVTRLDLAAAIYFAEKYPNLDDFQHSKTISWEPLKGELLEEIKAEQEEV